jgi:hypothetical protein
LAVGITEYSHWRWFPSQAGYIPSIDVNRRLMDRSWALELNAIACHVQRIEITWKMFNKQCQQFASLLS